VAVAMAAAVTPALAATRALAATSAVMALRRVTAAGEVGTTPEDMDTAAMDLTAFTATAVFASRPRSVRSAPSVLFGKVVLAPAAGVCPLRGAGSDMKSRCSDARVISVP
jgi:hypothetical protein